MLVEGQPGIGKSRLLAEAIDAAAERGFTHGHGATDDPRQLKPLAPLMAALGESIQTLLTAREIVPSDAVDLRLWLADEIQARLEERVAHGPLLITLDDLQWADTTTLLALRSLIPELASYPLVWILSRTTGIGDSDVDKLYEVLERDGATRILLEALSEQAVAGVITDVLGAAPGPELLALAAGAGGNPFMLIELLAGLHSEGAVEVAADHARLVSQRLPQRVQEIARNRLGRLHPPTRHLLQVAAVLGRSFYVNDLADMFGEPTTRLLPALEEAEAAGVVIPAADRLSFRHDLLWRAITETLTEPVRQALHWQAAEMLLKRGGSAIPAATHLMQYARPGDIYALAGLDRAVREVLPSSPQTAADIAARAVELSSPSDPGRFDRTKTAVHTLTSAGRLREAAELARAALCHTMPPGHAAHLRYQLAYVLILAGRPLEAVVEAEEMLSQQDLSDELRGLAEHVLLTGMNIGGEYRRGRKRAEATVAAEECRNQPALMSAHVLLTSIARAEGRAADGIGHIRKAARYAASGPFQAQCPRLYLASILTDMRQLEEAETLLQAATEEITALGHTAHAASPALFRAKLRLAQGRLDDAAAEAQAGLAMAADLGMHIFDPFGIAVLAIVTARRGDIDTAARHYKSRHQAGQGPAYGIEWCDWGMALITEAQDGPHKTIEVLNALYTDPPQQSSLPMVLMTEPAAAAWLTRLALAVAERPGAEVVAAMAERLAEDNPSFSTLAASAAHAHGILHNDPKALTHAVSTHVGPWDRASAAEDLGVLLARTAGGSDHDAAILSLDQAFDGYQQTGALRDAARVRATLRKLGVRRRHWTTIERPTSGWASLTDTERNIVTLVAQGLTNPQVATRLFISRHTVKYHLGHIFSKLDIGSRVELARLATDIQARQQTGRITSNSSILDDSQVEM
ncbi:helix-turn-helix transcriptional regulator [Planotetraspora silvatica]|uniref:Helix-turn-helix transcriptional regulator n=1 Tax=Planotetraspora silvatica TaxID=234614 RepID=A0A8J3XPS2_9ACTN|nr:helix-turn-helix transcriptional regulator [Planotetraspora silvatica]